MPEQRGGEAGRHGWRARGLVDGQPETGVGQTGVNLGTCR